jgi:KUP system potassium uptake protein
VETYGTDFIFRVRLDLGFKCSQRINEYLRQIVADLQSSGELPGQDKRYSIYGESAVGSFQFCIIHKSVPSAGNLLSGLDKTILNMKYRVRRVAGSKTRWYGLDNSSLIVETVPLVVTPRSDLPRICRVQLPQQEQ